MSVAPLLGLPLRDRHLGPGELWLAVAVRGEVDVPQVLVVVALGEVGAELRPARLLALERPGDDALGHVEHVPQFEDREHVLVEHRAAVVDPGALGLLAKPADDLVRLGEPLFVAEDGDVAVQRLPELVLDRRHPATAVLAVDDLVELVVLVLDLRADDLGHRDALGPLRRVLARAAAEDQRVEQGVRAQAVAAVDRDARHLAGGVEAGDRRRAVDVGLDAAHDVVLAGADQDRLARDVDAGEVLADVDDLAQRLERALARDDRDVEVDPDAAGPDAAALVDLGLLGARDDVARGQLHLVGRVLLHEALALGVEQVGALAARALGDQEPVLHQGGRVVLDHLHVHQRRADAVGLGDAVAGADQAVGRRLEALAGAAGGQDDVLGGEDLQPAGADVAGDAARDAAVLVLEQRGGEPLLVAVHALVVLHELLVEHVEDRLAGDVGDVGRALHGGAAEGAEVQVTGLVAVERDADVLEVHDLVRRLAAHHLDRVLVTDEVGALDRVVGVRAPVVGWVDGGVDAAGGGDRVRADRMDLAHDRHRRSRVRGGQGGPLSGQAGAEDEDVVCRHVWGSSSRSWGAWTL